MEKDISQILLKVLDIIDFKDDKDAFIHEFLGLSLIEASTQTLQSASEEEKAKFKEDFSSGMSAVNLQKSIETLSENPLYKKMLIKSIQNAFYDLIQKIIPTLSEEKKDELDQYLQSLSME